MIEAPYDSSSLMEAQQGRAPGDLSWALAVRIAWRRVVHRPASRRPGRLRW